MTNNSEREALVFIGPPTSGKTSHSQRFAQEWAGIDKPIKGSDIIPDLVPVYEKKRELIPDEVFLAKLKECLSQEKRRRVVFDNIPRTAAQATCLSEWAQMNGVSLTTLVLELSRDEILYRFQTRTFCPVDRESYHPVLKPPVMEGFCDKHPNTCLIPRPGDSRENLSAIQRYRDELAVILPVLGRNGITFHIDALGQVSTVGEVVANAIRL